MPSSNQNGHFWGPGRSGAVVVPVSVKLRIGLCKFCVFAWCRSFCLFFTFSLYMLVDNYVSGSIQLNSHLKVSLKSPVGCIKEIMKEKRNKCNKLLAKQSQAFILVVTCHMSHVKIFFFTFFLFFLSLNFLTKWWSQSVEGLLSTGPNPSSFFRNGVSFIF